MAESPSASADRSKHASFAETSRKKGSTKSKGKGGKTEWRNASRLITNTLRLSTAWRTGGDDPIFTLVNTEEGLERCFKQLDEYLRIKMKQDLYMVFLGFFGKEISRKGEVNLVSMTTLTGLTWIIDSQTLGEVFWSSAKKLFSDPYTEKVVFDGKHIADYLLNRHGYELRGVYDLVVLEALERGHMLNKKPLPKTRTVPENTSVTEKPDKHLFMNRKLVAHCFLDEAAQEKCKIKISDEQWKNRTELGGPLLICLDYVLEYQRFNVKFSLMFNFISAMATNVYLRWWISSELYCSILSEKKERTYDEIESSPVIPTSVLCRESTEQPLGIVRCVKCSRFLPTKVYTFQMLCREKSCICSTCVKIGKHIYTRAGFEHVMVKSSKSVTIKEGSGKITEPPK